MWFYQVVLFLFLLHFIFFLVFHPLITIYYASQNPTLIREHRWLSVIGILLTWGVGNLIYVVIYRHQHPKWQRISRYLFLTGVLTALLMRFLYYQLPQTV